MTDRLLENGFATVKFEDLALGCGIWGEDKGKVTGIHSAMWNGTHLGKGFCFENTTERPQINNTKGEP